MGSVHPLGIEHQAPPSGRRRRLAAALVVTLIGAGMMVLSLNSCVLTTTETARNRQASPVPSCECIAGAWCAVTLILTDFGLNGLADAMDPVYGRGQVGSSVLTTFLFQLLPGMALVLPCTVWMANWWYLACRRYLQLERPGRVTAVLTLILFLLATITELVFT